MRGLLAGLTRAQVEHDWFTDRHFKAARRELPYEEYEGLSYDQADGLVKSLKRRQVVGLDRDQINFVCLYNLPDAAIIARATTAETMTTTYSSWVGTLRLAETVYSMFYHSETGQSSEPGEPLSPEEQVKKEVFGNETLFRSIAKFL